MNIHKSLVVADGPQIFLVNQFATVTSLVANTVGGTYTCEYTCTPAESSAAKVWLPVPDMTNATTAQAKEFGVIAGFRFTVIVGTATFDILQAK